MIEILTAPEETNKFARFISTRKRELDKWVFLHVEILDDDAKIGIDEIIQFIEFQFQDKNCVIFRMSKTRELVIVSNNENNSALTTFDQKIYENFESTEVRSNTYTMNESSLEKLSVILTRSVDEDDTSAQINIRRMKRLSNAMMVVDDDLMVCKQFEQILAGFGSCVVENTTKEFFEVYEKYAPDILFLDIHLQTDHGPDLMKKLLAEVDPHAHVIIISSDTFAKTIKEIKEKGAKGFIVKPFNRQQLFGHVMKMPTFAPRKT